MFAFAAAQVKKAMEVTHELGGEGYIFWGGREGYTTLAEHRHEARAGASRPRSCTWPSTTRKTIGFKGQFYIEPKPKEPTKHQYDSDAAACLNFLREYDLLERLQAEHRDQPRHARRPHDAARTGSRRRRRTRSAPSTPIRAMNCWAGTPTSSRPNIYLTTQIMLSILKMGGFTTGGMNFDAKVRRESFEPVDLFHAHIGGMDAFARGLKIAAAIRKDGRLAEFVKQRYSSWDSGHRRKDRSGQGRASRNWKRTCSRRATSQPNTSGRQEFLENLINEFI